MQPVVDTKWFACSFFWRNALVLCHHESETVMLGELLVADWFNLFSWVSFVHQSPTHTSNIVWTSLWFLHPFWIFTSSSLVTNKLWCRGRACEKSCSLRGVQDDQGGCSLHWSKCGTLASVKVFMATHWLGLGQTGSILETRIKEPFSFFGAWKCVGISSHRSPCKPRRIGREVYLRLRQTSYPCGQSQSMNSANEKDAKDDLNVAVFRSTLAAIAESPIAYLR